MPVEPACPLARPRAAGRRGTTGGVPPTPSGSAWRSPSSSSASPWSGANTSVEIHIAELLTPPPDGVRWLITALWFVGSLGVIVLLVLLGLLVPRLAAVRQMALAGVTTLAVCLLLDALLGPDGRPSARARAVTASIHASP